MSSLVSATLDRRVNVNGETHLVRAALTGEALAILAAIENPTDSNWEVVVEIVAQWLPPQLVEVLATSDRETVLVALRDIIMEGMPELDRKHRTDPDRPIYRSRDEWEDLVADYMHIYGVSATQALAEPWGAFVLMASKIQQVVARDQFRYLQTKGLQFIRDPKERKQAYDDLVERGKLPVLDKDAERRRKLAKQAEWLRDLDREFSVIRNNPNA